MKTDKNGGAQNQMSIDNPARRPLPERDSERDKHDPGWHYWSHYFPQQPGWYWVCGPKLWPQCIQFHYEGGKIVAIDRHSIGPIGPWNRFAGPIPDPHMPRNFFAGAGYSTKGVRWKE